MNNPEPENPYSNNIADFLDFLREAAVTHRAAADSESEADKATQDILHDLELGEHSYHESAKLARTIAKVRRARRNAKDVVLILSPVVAWIETNQAAFHSLEKLLGDIRKEERGTQNRVYIPRTNILNEICQ